jgi:Rap1a immunity proteins
LRLIRLAFSMAMLISLPAVAVGEPARDMLAKCTESLSSLPKKKEMVSLPRTFSAGWCWGAFEVIQRLIVYSDEANQHLFPACAPPDSTRVEIIRVFLDYAKRHPLELDQEFTEIALTSLTEAFPCK